MAAIFNLEIIYQVDNYESGPKNRALYLWEGHLEVLLQIYLEHIHTHQNPED